MDFFNVLGIEPTKDKREIKKAYAAKLRIYNPEEDAEGFQKITEAFNNAIRFADGKKIITFQTSESEKIDENEVEDTNENIEDPVDEFMMNVSELYSNFFDRIEPANWEKLLDSEIMWNINVKPKIEYRLLEFLTQHNNLPQEVWKVLDKNFLWGENRESLTKIISVKYINFLMYKIYSKWSFRYSFFKKECNCDYDTFINLREDAYNDVLNNNMKEAGEKFKAAYDIYKDDADLLRLYGKYLLRQGYVKQALDLLSHLVEIAPSEFEGYNLKGEALLSLGQYEKAYDDFKKSLDLRMNNYNAIVGIAFSLYNLKKLKEAAKYYDMIVEMRPNNIDAAIKRRDIYNRLYHQTIEDISIHHEKLEPKYDLANVYFKKNMFDKCVLQITSIENEGHMNNDMYLLKGMAYLKQNEFEKGNICFRSLINKFDSKDDKAYKKRGLAYYYLKEFELAKNDFETELKNDEKDSFSWSKKGCCELKLLQFKEAEKSFVNAFNYNNGLPVRTMLYYAISLFKNKKYLDALYQADSYRIYSNDPNLFILAGDACKALGYTDRAVSKYRQAGENGSNNLWVNKISVADFINSKKYDDALDCLDRMYKLNIDKEWVIKNILYIAIQTKKYEKYSEFLRGYFEACGDKTQDFNIYIPFYYGVVLYNLGKYKLSAECFKLSAKFELEGESYSYISMDYYEMDKASNALEYARKALEKEPANPDFKLRYENIMEYKHRSIFQRLTGKKVSSKEWDSPKDLKYQGEKADEIIARMPEFNLNIGDVL